MDCETSVLLDQSSPLCRLDFILIPTEDKSIKNKTVATDTGMAPTHLLVPLQSIKCPWKNSFPVYSYIFIDKHIKKYVLYTCDIVGLGSSVRQRSVCSFGNCSHYINFPPNASC